MFPPVAKSVPSLFLRLQISPILQTGHWPMCRLCPAWARPACWEHFPCVNASIFLKPPMHWLARSVTTQCHETCSLNNPAPEAGAVGRTGSSQGLSPWLEGSTFPPCVHLSVCLCPNLLIKTPVLLNHSPSQWPHFASMISLKTFSKDNGFWRY